MDLKKIYDIVERIEKSNLTRFEYSEKDMKIVLEKNSGNDKSYISNVTTTEKYNIPEKVNEGNYIKSPIVGTYYSKPSPESEAFVSVGDKVKKGDVLCVIEAMKLFNEIQAECDGVIKEILVNDGDMVAFDQPIMLIDWGEIYAK